MKVTKESLLVYAITDRYWLNGNKLSNVVEDVLKNGATFLQLREKEFSHEEMVQEAKEIKAIAAKYHVPFAGNRPYLCFHSLLFHTQTGIKAHVPAPMRLWEVRFE